MRHVLTPLIFAASSAVLFFPAQANAQSVAPTPTPAASQPKTTVAPKPAPVPDRVRISGTARAFYFTRGNQIHISPASAACTAPVAPFPPNTTCFDQSAFNLGGKLHAEYTLPKTPWTLGATYMGATPLGANSSDPRRTDNTLPGYSLSLFGELYVQYKTKYVSAQLGKELVTTPWANPSDSRIIPVTFQGITLSGALTPRDTLGVMRMARWHPRNTSTFDANTILTSCNPYACNRTNAPPMSGFLLAYLQHKFTPSWVANAYAYQIYDVANLLHVDSKYNWDPHSRLNPYIAMQYIAESDTGVRLAGAIHNHTIGAQIGASLTNRLDAVLSYNRSPLVRYLGPTAGSSACGSLTVTPLIFCPAGGTLFKTASPVPGMSYYYGGGLASPYTDSYATDPLYTTSISQGMADRRSAGNSYKLALTGYSVNRRIRAIVSDALYNYGTPAGKNHTTEFNADLTFFFNAVDPKKPYTGLSLRHRYAARSQPTLPFNFTYNRTQLEYTF